MTALLPDGVTHIADLPYTHLDAIKLGLNFLSYEQLEKDERPPRDIWLKEEAMTNWWQEVERNREIKYGGDGASAGGGTQRNSYVDELVQ